MDSSSLLSIGFFLLSPTALNDVNPRCFSFHSTFLIISTRKDDLDNPTCNFTGNRSQLYACSHSGTLYFSAEEPETEVGKAGSIE
jgi:hypothetical protein